MKPMFLLSPSLADEKFLNKLFFPAKVSEMLKPKNIHNSGPFYENQLAPLKKKKSH